MAVWNPGGKKHANVGTLLSRASRPQDFTRPFFPTVFFRVTHDGLSERGITRSLISVWRFLAARHSRLNYLTWYHHAIYFKTIAKASHEPDYSYKIMIKKANFNLVLAFEKLRASDTKPKWKSKTRQVQAKF